jgi:hypothetical protein
MLHDTVRLAQPDRKAEEVVAQKETTKSVIRSIDFNFLKSACFEPEIFRADEAWAFVREGAYKWYVTD